MSSIVWIDEGVSATELLGGKVASLAAMTAAGFAVPLAFGITTEAFAAFSAEGDLLDEVRRARAGLDLDDLSAVEATSTRLTDLVARTPLPVAVDRDVRAAYARLEERTGLARVPVAVRSSGVSEDLEGASFAGQYDTYLWIRGADDVLAHLKRCWAGLFGPAVLTYRPRDGLEALPGMAVGVQQMVRSRTAGVLFTLDPVNGDRSKIVMEACWGLGEGVVKGDVTPDRFRVDKVTLEILERTITPQTEEYRFDEAAEGVDLLPLDAARGARSCLDDAEVVAVAELGKRVERHRGAPQDVEWAIDDEGRLHLLQARPETVWSTKPIKPVASGSSTAVDRVLAKFMGGGR